MPEPFGTVSGFHSSSVVYGQPNGLRAVGAEGITARVPSVLFAAIHPAQKELGLGAVDICVWALEGDVSPDSYGIFGAVPLWRSIGWSRSGVRVRAASPSRGCVKPAVRQSF